MKICIYLGTAVGTVKLVKVYSHFKQNSKLKAMAKIVPELHTLNE